MTETPKFKFPLRTKQEIVADSEAYRADRERRESNGDILETPKTAFAHISLEMEWLRYRFLHHQLEPKYTKRLERNTQDIGPRIDEMIENLVDTTDHQYGYSAFMLKHGFVGMAALGLGVPPKQAVFAQQQSYEVAYRRLSGLPETYSNTAMKLELANAAAHTFSRGDELSLGITSLRREDYGQEWIPVEGQSWSAWDVSAFHYTEGYEPDAPLIAYRTDVTWDSRKKRIGKINEAGVAVVKHRNFFPPGEASDDLSVFFGTSEEAQQARDVALARMNHRLIPNYVELFPVDEAQ